MKHKAFTFVRWHIFLLKCATLKKSILIFEEIIITIIMLLSWKLQLGFNSICFSPWTNKTAQGKDCHLPPCLPSGLDTEKPSLLCKIIVFRLTRILSNPSSSDLSSCLHHNFRGCCSLQKKGQTGNGCHSLVIRMNYVHLADKVDKYFYTKYFITQDLLYGANVHS